MNDVIFVGRDTGGRIWLVVRFPNGEWSGGGRSSDPEYECCEKYKAWAVSFEHAKSKCQSYRRRQAKKGLMPIDD